MGVWTVAGNGLGARLVGLEPPTAPRTVEQIRGGYKVLDANGQSLAYVYGRETKAMLRSPTV